MSSVVTRQSSTSPQCLQKAWRVVALLTNGEPEARRRATYSDTARISFREHLLGLCPRPVATRESRNGA